MTVERVPLRLDAPPEVANVGVGVHGTHSSRDVFRLPDLWQLHLYSYAADLTVDGTGYPVRPGSVSLVPPGVQVEFAYRGRSEHLYAHFRTPSTGPVRQVPVVQDAGAQTPLLAGLLRQAIEASPQGTAQVSAEIWTALWRVAQLAENTGDRPHPAVATAIAYVETNLARTLTVPDLARAAGVSHNHLTRLFRAETGSTVVAYLRERRMARARHLLTSSTLPIPAVAAAVGITDLQAFNKACRRELGGSPRTIRAGGR